MLHEFNFIPFNQHLPIFPTFSPLLTTVLLSVSTFLDSTYKWNHVVFFLSFWLISFSIRSSRLIQIVVNDRIIITIFYLSLQSVCTCTGIHTHTRIWLILENICEYKIALNMVFFREKSSNLTELKCPFRWN